MHIVHGFVFVIYAIDKERERAKEHTLLSPASPWQNKQNNKRNAAQKTYHSFRSFLISFTYAHN